MIGKLVTLQVFQFKLFIINNIMAKKKNTKKTLTEKTESKLDIGKDSNDDTNNIFIGYVDNNEKIEDINEVIEDAIEKKDAIEETIEEANEKIEDIEKAIKDAAKKKESIKVKKRTVKDLNRSEFRYYQRTGVIPK